MDKGGIYKEPSFVDTLKEKLVDVASDYFKRNYERTKADVMKYIEKTIERKIRKEVRKYAYTSAAYFLFLFGIVFLIYGGIGAVVYLLNLPSFLTNVIFGILAVGIGAVVYLLR